MTGEDLLKLIKKTLEADADLDFLMKLSPQELTTLLVCIRDRLSKEGNG